MKYMLLSITAIMLSVGLRADIKVSDVEVFSGYPWKEIVVGYTISGTDISAETVRLTATDKMSNKSYTAKTLIGAKVTEGRHVMRWDAASEGVKLLSENVVFAVSVVSIGVQLWANGPVWADCNVGATQPEEVGLYFSWGDTVGQEWRWYNSGKYAWSEGGFSTGRCATYNKDEATLKSQGYIDSAGNLVTKYDAASKYFGMPWRLPTATEWEALMANCTVVWTERNYKKGLLVTGKGDYASKSIFLPAAGWGNDIYRVNPLDGSYRSSTPSLDNNYDAIVFHFSSSGTSFSRSSRFNGDSVRPVRGAVR